MASPTALQAPPLAFTHSETERFPSSAAAPAGYHPVIDNINAYARFVTPDSYLLVQVRQLGSLFSL